MRDESPLLFEGSLSPGLRALIQSERDRIGEVTQRAVRMIVSSVPDYSLSIDPRIVEDLSEATRINADLWFAALLDRVAVTSESMEPIVVFARRRVHQGISMMGLLRAYRIIARAFWLRMIERAEGDLALGAELACVVSPYLLQHFDVVAEAIATHYLQEQSQHLRWRDRLRQELWSIIRSRPDDGHGFRQLTEALGLGSDQPHCALALRLSEEARARPERYIDAPLMMLGRKLGLSADHLMRALHQDHLVVWIPQPAGMPAVSFERSLAETAASSATVFKSIAGLGIGLPGVGANGWLSSFEQAFRALQEPALSGSDGSVFRYSRMMIDDTIRSGRNVAEFVRSAIDALAGEAALMETLHAYLKHGLHRKEAAAALEIHPNTLDHRLSRIESLLGGTFSDIEWLERINASLRLHRHRA